MIDVRLFCRWLRGDVRGLSRLDTDVSHILSQWERVSACLDFRWPACVLESCECELEEHTIASCEE